VPYKSVESLKVDEICVERWLGDLGPRTALNYGDYFLRYRDWFRGRGYWLSAQSMIEDYERLDDRDRYRHVDVLKEYIKSKGTGSRDKRNAWFAARSFYSYHRSPLPELPRNEASRLFGLSMEDKRRALELAPVMLEDVRRLILDSPQPYRAAFMVMFQGAMGLAEFIQFNLDGWRRVVGHLDEPGPLRVDLYREKTSRTSVSRYYTFLGEDGKKLIKEWLVVRPNVDTGALFVVYNKNSKEWVPMRPATIGSMLTKVAKRSGLIKPNGLNRYHIHAHEFRDLFKSMCTLSGVAPVASELFLGHSIDKLGYDKSPRYSEDWFRSQYEKVEPRLNLLSNPSGEDLAKRIEASKGEAIVEAVRSFARALGIDPLRVRIERQKEIGREPTPDEEVEAIQDGIRRLVIHPQRPKNGQGGGNNCRKYETRLVTEGKLLAHLDEGWDIVKELVDGKIVVRRPLDDGD
jgi:hypothetical protein